MADSPSPDAPSAPASAAPAASASSSRTFRFRPRYRGIAWSSLGIGGVLGTLSIAVLGAAALPLATGAAGVVLGAAYLMSPTWKLAVIIDDTGLEVRSPKATKFRLAWSDVSAVIAAPSSHTAFVDGGAPERSLLVPGEGAPAPYDIEDRPALVAAILAHVAPAKVTTVASLEDVR